MMVVTKTPLRVSLLGGSTDAPEFYETHGGGCLSLALDKHVTVVAKALGEHVFIVHSRGGRQERVIWQDIGHDLIRECFRELQWGDEGVEICIMSDVPFGTGLGSSSSLTVGVLNALSALRGTPLPQLGPEGLLWTAAKVEIQRCGSPIGIQDHCPAVHGNFRRYHFENKAMRFEAPLRPAVQAEILRHLYLIRVGGTREANDILSDQQEKSQINTEALVKMRDIADEATRDAYNGNTYSIPVALRKMWAIKKGLSEGVSSPAVEALCEELSVRGAKAVKLCGAGGAGFLVVWAPPVNHHEIMDLAKYGFEIIRPGVSKLGSQVVYSG